MLTRLEDKARLHDVFQSETLPSVAAARRHLIDLCFHRRSAAWSRTGPVPSDRKVTRIRIVRYARQNGPTQANITDACHKESSQLSLRM